MKQIHLSKDFSIPAMDYAIQGNAILGIREAGKTVTAKKTAEGLMNAQIPIIAFDPTGVWKYLKVGRDTPEGPVAGYAIVVVGNGGDIELHENTIEAVVRAAMEENVSIILDLFGNRNKSLWRRIIERTGTILLNENHLHGVRHLYIEEAREFAPQRLHGEINKVYSVLESIGAMGGNSSLGYSLINQRAEDVNKSLLEITERMIIHRQTGKNSLKGIAEWLKLVEAPNLEEIKKSLASLPTGKCWVCAKLTHEPMLVTVEPTATIHPDRRKPVPFHSAMQSDVTEFVAKLKRSLARQSVAVEAKVVGGKAKKEAEPIAEVIQVPQQAMVAQEKLEAAERRVEELTVELNREKNRVAALTSQIAGLREYLRPKYEALRKVFEELTPIEETISVDTSKYDAWRKRLGSGEREMLDHFIQHKRLKKQQLIILMGKSRETVRIYLGTLKRAQLVREEKDECVLNEL